MEIRALGCYGADALLDNGQRCNPTGFLVNRSLLLEAGTSTGALTLSEITALRHVLLSHSHLDHIQSLSSLTEALFGRISVPLTIIATAVVIDVLKAHFFNGLLWPDFTKLPTPEHPTIQYRLIEPGRQMTIEGVTVTAIPVVHSVPTVGFVIEDSASAIVYSGDTWSTDSLWLAASATRNLKAAMIEVSFPDEMASLVRVSGHLTPTLAYREFQKLKRPDLPLYLYHMKPAFLGEIQKQVKALGNPNIHMLQDGGILTF